MITHKDKLQNQIKKLQSLINDILESELKEKLSIGGGIIQEINSSNVTANNIKTTKLESNNSSTNTLTTNNITNSDSITTKNLNFKILKTPNNYSVKPLHINFNVVYTGTSATTGYIVFAFNNSLGFEYNGVVELFNCVGQIEDSSSFTITDTYKLSVGIDINNLMKCEVHYADSTTTGYTVYNIKYIVGTLYTENSPCSIYQYKTGYTNGDYLMRGDNVRFPTNHAIFCFKYMSISKN